MDCIKWLAADVIVGEFANFSSARPRKDDDRSSISVHLNQSFMLLITLLGASLCAAYSICDTAIYPYKDKNVTVSLVPSATRAVSGANNATIPVVVSGSVRVVDGCNFQAVGLVITGPATAQFYGSLGSALAVVVTPTVIVASPNPQSLSMEFVKTPGASVSWTDFDTISLYDPVTRSLLASAKMPLPAASAPAPNATKLPSSSETSSAVVSTAMFSSVIAASVMAATMLLLFA